jgi:asparagine synthase (glutamine-hydrolysing)
MDGLVQVRARKWAELRWWPGSYVSVVQTQDETIVMGDLSGLSRIYYIRTPDGHYWSSSATALAALSRSSVDLTVLALDMAANGIERFGGSTPFMNVEATPPGALLRLSRNNANVEAWYSPRTETSFATTASRLKRVLTEGVQRRSKNGQLSGDFAGIDSSTLIYLASKTAPIDGITYIDPWTTREDHEYAEAIARSSDGGITQRTIQGDNRLLFLSGLSGEHSVPVTDLPSNDLIAVAQSGALYHRAKGLGSTDHMTGDGGDSVLSAGAVSLADLYHAGKPLEAMRWARWLARRYKTSPGAMMAAGLKLSRTSYSTALRRMAVDVQKRHGSTDRTSGLLTWCHSLASAAWLTPESAAEVGGIVSQLAANSGDIRSPGALQDWLGVRVTTSHLLTERDLFEQGGLSLHRPYLDAAVLDTCLSLPGYLRAGERDRFKPLVTEGMTDLFPEVLTRRTTKGTFGMSAMQGVSQNAGFLRSVVADSQLIGANVLNRAAVVEGIERVIAGVDSLHISVLLFVSAEHWLRHLDVQFNSWWEEQ